MKKYLILAIILITTAQSCFCTTEVISEDLQQALKVHSPNEPGVFSILVALFFVICLIYVTGIIYSKLNVLGAKTVKENFKQHDLTNAFVLSTTQLGQGKNLHVVEIDGIRLLIGATPSSINLIKELKTEPDQKKIDNIEDEIKEEVVVEAEEFNLHKKYL